MKPRAEKIMPLSVTCTEFSCLLYGLIDPLEFLSSYSAEKNYEKISDDLDVLRSNSSMIQTGFIKKLESINKLKDALITEIKNNPEIQERNYVKNVVNIGLDKKFLNFKPKTVEGETSLEFTYSTTIAYEDVDIDTIMRLGIDTWKNELDFKVCKWPFFLLLHLCITEFEPDYQNFEGWIVDFLNKNFDIGLLPVVQLGQSSNVNNIAAQEEKIETSEESVLLHEDKSIDDSIDIQITNTEAWKDLQQNTRKAISSFREWKTKQSKPNNIPMSHIDDWLANELPVTKRVAEIIKKILREIYNL